MGVLIEIENAVERSYIPDTLTVLRAGLNMSWRIAIAPVTARWDGTWTERSDYSVDSDGLLIGLLVIGGLSIHMGLLNLLPVPGLDGGQIMFLLMGKLRGRPVSWRMRHGAEMLGICLVFGAIAVVLILDLLSHGGQ